MTDKFFKEVCRYIISNILQGVPDGERLEVYRKQYGDGVYYSISCGGYEYSHYSNGNETFRRPEGLNDEN